MFEGGEQLSEIETNGKCEGLVGYWGPTEGLALDLQKGHAQLLGTEKEAYRVNGLLFCFLLIIKLVGYK